MNTAKTLLMACLLCAARAQAQEPALPGVAAFLPQGAKIAWAVQPLSAENAGKADARETLFAVDASTRCWLLLDGRVALELESQRAFALDVKADSFAAAGKGLLFSSGDSAGTAGEPSDPPQMLASGLPVLPFRPFAVLPLKKSRLFAGKDTLYLSGEKDGRNELWRISGKNGPAAYEPVFASDAPIAAVAEQGKTIYAAAGNLIFKIAPGGKTTPVLDAGEPVTGLAAPSGKGLFYALRHGVMFFNDSVRAEALLAEKPQIQAAGGSLYIFLPENLGVARVDNPAAFNSTGRKAPASKEKNK
ncbi:MAG: hypothetical protein GX410_05655 [Elusimicrobia bacterium]|nr:hypothetical protein [Elusimicrobiota bacterium]